MQTYTPNPIDTSNVIVDEKIIQLGETLAKNTHENWAKTKIDEGWTYGKTLDEKNKTHPCLVPYEQLTQAEKEYDRKTSLETLKVLLYLGFEIKK